MADTWNDYLYKYGFLFTDDQSISIETVGINVDKWAAEQNGKWKWFVHKLQTAFWIRREDAFAILFGHAYNPFTMEAEESSILGNLLDLMDDPEKFYDYFDQISGSFCLIIDYCGKVSVFTDCAGMYGANYCVQNTCTYVSSHFQMIADLHGFQEDPYISRMKKAKTWPLYGYYLPGDLTAYAQIKRVIPNVAVRLTGTNITFNRFYPRKPYAQATGTEYEKAVQDAGEILNHSLRLIAEKWKNPAISLTGGMDSKTTLACAADAQNCFSYYSYISLPRERTDALAAQEISKQLGLRHEIIEIKTGSYGEDHDKLKEIIKRHYGYLGNPNDNDVDKRIELLRQFHYDVEVKSWVSEIVRASRYTKYDKKSFPDRPTPRMLTSMYKIFLANRKDARETDQYFKEYLEKTELLKCVEEYSYPWTEFFVWEIVFGGWGGLALTGEHMISNNVTVPFNNRALLDLMLRTPLDKRRTDTLHRDLIAYMDQRVNETGISVTNGNETRFRAICEKIYYEVHSRIPL